MTKIEEAIMFATLAHEGQKRKINLQPYILHPLEVANIIINITTDEDVLVAAILHDTLEDTKVTEGEILEKFGPKVLRLVQGETEKRDKLASAYESWQSRKEESLFRLQKASLEEKLICLGDKLSNMRSIYQGYKHYGNEVFCFFHNQNKASHAWYYREILKVLDVFRETEAYQEYQKLIEEIFGE